MTAAEAGRVSLNSLANGDARAIDAIRRALEVSLVEDRATSEESNDMLTFFDRGVAAAKEARRDARAHHELAKLYDFGRKLGTTETAIEAQSLAWIIGVERFLTIENLPPQLRPTVAEPFFAAILNVTPPAQGRAELTWSEYLAAAARSTGAAAATNGANAKAIGGGPNDTTEDANLREIARTTEERLRSMAQRLPPASDIRVEAERTAAKLRTIDDRQR
jgi:hypothetical protein